VNAVVEVDEQSREVTKRSRAATGLPRAMLSRLAHGYWCITNVAGLMRQLTEEAAAAASM